MINLSSLKLAFLLFAFCIASFTHLIAQKNTEVTIENAKGLYLKEILTINSLNPDTHFGAGKGSIFFKIKGNYLFVANLITSKGLYLNGVKLYKVNLDNTKEITSATLDLSEHLMPTFSDICLLENNKFALISKYGVLEGEWTDTIATVTHLYILNQINFLPKKGKVLNDSTLLLTAYNGGMYQNFIRNTIYPAGYGLYNLNSHEITYYKPTLIKGSIFMTYSGHRFISTVGNNIVHSNGFNYTLYLEDINKHVYIDTLHQKIKDPYWVEVSEAEINALNALDRKTHYNEIVRAYAQIRLRISNIHSIHSIEGNDNMFLVYLRYGNTYFLKHREYEKTTSDLYTIKDNKLKKINSDIHFPNNIKSTDTINNKHHMARLTGESSFSNKYAVLFHMEHDVEDFKQMILSENSKNTLHDYYTIKSNQYKEAKPLSPYLYIYKYY